MSNVPPAPGLGQVDAYRPWFREHVRPRGYSPVVHVMVHIGPAIACCAYAASRLDQVSVLEWLTVPSMLIFGSAFVYWFHRFVLHRPTRPSYFAYERHTLQHHRFFDYEHITADEQGDLYIMLFPWWSGLVLSIVVLLLSLALTPLVGTNVAHLVMFMATFYLLLYEAVHTVSHLPDEHLLTRLPVLSFLREHHRIHHEPGLMGKHNFNVVIPLFDWLFGALLLRRPGRAAPVRGMQTTDARGR